MKVLFDADSLIAIYSLNDPSHENAYRLGSAFEHRTKAQFVTWDVIDEVSTKLRYQVSKEVSEDFFEQYFQS